MPRTAFDLSLTELTRLVETWGEPAYRGRQIFEGLWRRSSTYQEMTNLPARLREVLAEEIPLGMRVVTERIADRGATRKALLELGGGHVVETVLMAYPDRVTVCVSAQSGCAMAC